MSRLGIEHHSSSLVSDVPLSSLTTEKRQVRDKETNMTMPTLR